MNPDGNPPAATGCTAPAMQAIQCDDKGMFADARAHWLAAGTIAWPASTSEASFELHYADCGIRVEGGEVVGSAGSVALLEDGNGLPDPLRARFPHLAGHRALALDAAAIEQVPSILKGQIIVAGKDESGAVVSATRVQTAGVLDDLFTYDGPLGLELSSRQKATFRLWAPTARWVCLHVYDQSKQEIASIDMSEGERGVWSASEPQDASWYGSYYNYEVYVFSPVALEYPAGDARMVTDPYSVGLSANSRHSMIVDLGDPATKPEGWDELAKPELAAPEDIVIYEAHIRDFSISDETVPLEHRGKYVAFSYDGSSPERPMSNGMSHLIALAEAGMSHLHILPAFDIATIDEDPMSRVDLDDTFDRLCERNPTVPTQDCTAYAGQTIREVVASLDPFTGDAQRISGYLRELDGFNWGYDPFHYTTPEGSYSTDPDGIARILELRQMVQSLAHNGLRVAFDVVYNHTNASGLSETSVLDKIVPGYYHRLHPETGEVERSTCCDNTASEHAMMEKLMIDSLRVWATQYKIDSFRFDLMGHHMKANMLAVQRELASLTLSADGVDGSKIYIYGEGWDFGEVGNDARGVNATQLNMAGTGIGTFSDRLRDAVRGGGPFDGQASLRGNQGFINGMYYDPNELNGRSAGEQLDTLLLLADQIRVGMAGNLRDFVIIDRTGNPVKGSSVRYNGAPAGYTEDPQEVITYVANHDNQTLFDINQYKLPTGTSMANRVRVQNLGASIVLLGQGIPFVHMGMDMLRSKSMERDSYDSGDWFNKVDFTYRSNNWNVGLPRADNDEANWPIIAPIIANAIIDPQQQHIEAAAAHFREMLQVRKSSRLFRLETKDEVRTRVDFYNVGPEQIPGLIVMSITDGTCAGADLDPGLDSVLVLINAGDLTQLFNLPGAAGFELHPVLAASADPVVRTATFTRIDELTSEFRVPARTAAVFIQPQAGDQGAGLPCNDKVAASALTASVFVRGTMNDWSAPAAAELLEDPLDDSRYTVELVLDARTYELKIADSSWSTYNWGIDSGSITPGDGSHGLVSSGGNIVLTISRAGTYRFTLGVNDIDNPTLQVDARP